MSEYYRINGVRVMMSTTQAERWNANKLLNGDRDAINVLLPKVNGQHMCISLRRALNMKLSPETAQLMPGYPAVPEPERLSDQDLQACLDALLFTEDHVAVVASAHYAAKAKIIRLLKKDGM